VFALVWIIDVSQKLTKITDPFLHDGPPRLGAGRLWSLESYPSAGDRHPHSNCDLQCFTNRFTGVDCDRPSSPHQDPIATPNRYAYASFFAPPRAARAHGRLA
jgi:hypothetical protein